MRPDCVSICRSDGSGQGTKTYREAHMVSETDTGTLSRLLRGKDSHARGWRHRAYVVVSTTQMRRERRKQEEGIIENRNGKKEQTFKKTEGKKKWMLFHLSAFAWVLSLQLRRFDSDRAEEMESTQFVQACERDRERTRATHHRPEVRASLSTRSPAQSAVRSVHATPPRNFKEEKKCAWANEWKQPSKKSQDFLAWQRLESKQRGFEKVGQQTTKIDTS